MITTYPTQSATQVSKLANFLFYTFWTTMLVGKGLGWSQSASEFQIALFACIPFIFSKVVITKWTNKQLVSIFLMNMLGLAIWFFSGETAIILTTVTLTCIKDINIETLVKWSFWVKLSFFIITITLAFTGYINIQEMYRWNASGGFMQVRYGLGNGHPNATHYTLFNIYVFCILAYKNKLKYLQYLMMLIINFWLYQYTGSRTGLLMCSILLCGSYLIKKNNKVGEFIIKHFDNSYWILAIVSFIIVFSLPRIAFLTQLDTLTSRFNTAFSVVYGVKLSLFGLANVNTDFGYIDMLYSYGVIFIIVYLTLNTILLKKLKKYKLYLEYVIVLCYAIYTYSEAYSKSILMNVSLIYFAMVLYETQPSGRRFRDYLRQGRSPIRLRTNISITDYMRG